MENKHNNQKLSLNETCVIWIAAVLFALAAIIALVSIGSNIKWLGGMILYLFITIATGMTLSLFARLIKQSNAMSAIKNEAKT